MKKISSFALGFALLGLASCSSDEPVIQAPEGSNSTQGDVFATLTLSLPSTRSETDGTGETNSNATPDYEIGFDKENQVKGVYVVLARRSGTDWYYAGSSYQENVMANGMVGNKVSYTLSFESKELAKSIAAADGNTVDLNVFAFCNPTVALTEAIEGVQEAARNTDAFSLNAFFNSTETLLGEDGNGIWEDNAFLMSNARIPAAVTIPDYQTLVKDHGNVENPLKLGVVEVERVVSRFDFRDYVLTDKNTGNKYPANTYPVRIGSTDEIVAFVELEGMSLVNMAKEFYYLPRVSATGFNTPMTLCGVETPSNYVVSPNASEKTKTGAGRNLFNNYWFSLYNGTSTVSPNTYNYTLFSELSQDDNWGGAEKYKVWRYCTENTIPGVANQVQGISTGIYFKGRIVAAATAVNSEDWNETTTQAQKLAWAMDQKQILYYFNDETNNVVYAGVKDLIKVAQANPVSKLHAAVVAAFGNIDAEDFDIDSVKDLNGATKEGIGLYRPNDEGVYDIYYFYKNRHNDNLKNTEMGVMEFATVRNNVYKLYVSNIHKFGHPGNTPDDPDPEDPDDPDEKEKVYFDVQVHVLPWVVRVNNIEF